MSRTRILLTAVLAFATIGVVAYRTDTTLCGDRSPYVINVGISDGAADTVTVCAYDYDEALRRAFAHAK
jgi:hypothetical protein